MNISYLENLQGKTLYADDGSAIISIYSGEMASRIYVNIKELFGEIPGFLPIGELPTGEVIGLIQKNLVIVLHDSGEIVPSKISMTKFLEHIQMRKPDLEGAVFGEL